MTFKDEAEFVSDARSNSENSEGGTKMLKRLIGKIHNGRKGITGLETAIILIAFVVVAAVFAYTVLSAGLFASQKSSEAVYGGLEEAQSTLEIKGSVIAVDNDATPNLYVNQIKITLCNAIGGEPINFTPPTDAGNDGKADPGSSNVVVVSYTDQDQKVNDLYWTITKLGNADTDNLLEAGERFQLAIGGASQSGDLEDALATDIDKDTNFSIEIKPPVGAVLVIERTIPPIVDPVMNLN